VITIRDLVALSCSFESVSPVVAAGVLEMANQYSPGVSGSKLRLARLYLAAHNLQLHIAATSGSTVGQIASQSVGDTSVSYVQGSVNTGPGFESTTWGTALLALVEGAGLAIV
jgi:hypothetical protein